MSAIPQNFLRDGLSRIDAAANSFDKGRALEDFICFLFPNVPGIEIAQRNTLNAFSTEELDVALWNDRSPTGLYFLPHIVLVECKNWSQPCGSQEVSYFVSRLKQRGCDHGILVATHGITGVPEDITRAHFEMATALNSGIRVMLFTRQDFQNLQTSNDIVNLCKNKLCQLVVSGTNFL